MNSENTTQWLQDRQAEEGKSNALSEQQLPKMLRQEEDLQRALQAIGNRPTQTPNLSVMLHKAKWRNRLANWKSVSLGYGSGLATAFAIMLMFNFNVPVSQPEVEQQTVALKQVVQYMPTNGSENRVLNTLVNFEAKQDLPWAVVTIHLPKGMELEGFPGMQTVVWDASLLKGQNQLPLTLIQTEKQTEGEVEVEIESEQSPQTFSVPVKMAESIQVYDL